MCSQPFDDAGAPDVRRRRPAHIRARCLVETGKASGDPREAADIMTTPSGPGRARPDPSLSVIMGERRQLINLAYRLLGSLADAEDAVQETYARWYALSREQQEAIQSPGAWLTTVASRVCLDLLGSARARRERYVGEWLPEPLPEPAEQRRPAGHRRPGRPGHPRRVGHDGVPGRARDDDPGRAGRVRAARRLPLPLHRGGRDRRPDPGRLPPAGLLGPPPASARRGHPRLRPSTAPAPPRTPASSGTSRPRGKPRTSAPSSACSTPARPPPPTAAARSAPRSARSKAASRSPATWPASSAGSRT